MPGWNEYKDIARSRGALAFELFVVRTTPVAPERIGETLRRHLDYQKRLEADGVLAFAGPLSDPTGERNDGDGMIIYRAASMDEARRLADNDPMHADGVRTYEIRRWLINEGSLNISIGCAGQSVSLS